jgi:nitrate/nitrite-specific signal transduction histidine kinase
LALLLGGYLLLLVLPLTWAAIRHGIVKPLAVLLEGQNKIGKGDLTIRLLSDG